jgi:hypothetical protein
MFPGAPTRLLSRFVYNTSLNRTGDPVKGDERCKVILKWRSYEPGGFRGKRGR